MPNIFGVVLDLESAAGSLDLCLICTYLAAAGLEVQAGIERSTTTELLNPTPGIRQEVLKRQATKPVEPWM
jgi:hypothetical protein